MKLYSSIEKRKLLDELNNRIRSCEKCSLSVTRKNALIGEGNIDARIMFVALSPGAKEDVQNKMFVGPSGQVFNRLLDKVNIKRESVFMTNLVKCVLPKNRKPKTNEIELCSRFLEEEISIIQPEVIVPLGYYATQAIIVKYHTNPAILNRSFKSINGRLLFSDKIKVFPLTHPSALLYNPSFEPDTLKKYMRLERFL
ncbi:MAG: uracil-DNA glycosylase [Bacteroidetes bacterium 4572_77]|nr:MAG: uracil-DNA glycosylase [Bacteroidetes bacterium 4572_77]